MEQDCCESLVYRGTEGSWNHGFKEDGMLRKVFILFLFFFKSPLSFSQYLARNTTSAIMHQVNSLYSYCLPLPVLHTYCRGETAPDGQHSVQLHPKQWGKVQTHPCSTLENAASFAFLHSEHFWHLARLTSLCFPLCKSFGTLVHVEGNGHTQFLRPSAAP